jgi:hypothetical protein
MRKLLLIIVLFGCNPVKQVLKDKSKFDLVAAEVIRQGYCANDTLVIVKSDTIVKVDSLIEIYTDTTIINDTAYITLWHNRNFTKTFVIHDTLRSIIVDNARIKQLQTDLSKISKESEEHKQKATTRLYWFIIACAVVLFLILYKIR